ncbi:PilW family protein [Hydrogenophaga sp. 5NK40-0174]|uniref:PilW family protein n=1 Tax=Hydrogenophaga sp. 5NK40-0174 TaxID=3127649 RepID=UPI003104C0F0
MNKFNNRIRSVRRQAGLTLVELMIGVALGLLILSAVLYVFAGSVTSYRQQDSLSVVQESGRIALEVVNRDLRMAGNPGCGNLAFLEHQTPAEFSDAVSLTPAPSGAAATPDSVTIVRGSAEFAVVSTSPATNQVQLVSAAPLGNINPGDKLLLSDCITTDVMTVAAIAGNLVSGSAVSKQYPAGARVMRLDTVTYSVGGGELLRNGQAIATSVENLKFYYGISNGVQRAAARYDAAPAVAELSNIVAVKLSLSLVEGRPAARQVFSSTVALRNRAP